MNPMKHRVFKSNRAFEKFIEEVTNSTYIPTTKSELMDMDYIELKCRLMFNMAFYNAAIVLLNEEVTNMVEMICRWDEKLKKVRTLEALLNSKHFRENYESARCNFVTILMEHLPTLA